MKRAILFSLTIAGGLLLAAVVFGAQALRDPYTNKQLGEVLNKIFYNWLGDKAEKLVFITADGQFFVFAGDPGKVEVETDQLIMALARRGQSYKTVTNIIHSHNNLKAGFNERDLIALAVFKKLGFSGKFQIFYPATGRIKTYKGN